MADYIERETVLNALSVFNDRVHGNEHFLNGIETAKEIVDKTLSADVAPVVHGRWISVGHKLSRICSVCDCDEPYKFSDDDANVYGYCPHCGAKMDLLN